MFECWEFKGTGDRFFGGNADDRVLYRLASGSLKFLRGCDLHQYPGVKVALFDDRESADTAGIAATERNGLVSAMQHMPAIWKGRSCDPNT